VLQLSPISAARQLPKLKVLLLGLDRSLVSSCERLNWVGITSIEESTIEKAWRRRCQKLVGKFTFEARIYEARNLDTFLKLFALCGISRKYSGLFA
jgi:hypothetical protein